MEVDHIYKIMCCVHGAMVGYGANPLFLKSRLPALSFSLTCPANSGRTVDESHAALGCQFLPQNIDHLHKGLRAVWNSKVRPVCVVVLHDLLYWATVSYFNL